LEWKNVFLVGAQEGLLPHKKGEIAEEKRIFYVAITRAQKYLRISFSGTPSPFLEPFLTPEILEELRKTRTTVEKIQKQQELFA
jgi:superfamily I DNA/RNA helicase